MSQIRINISGIEDSMSSLDSAISHYTELIKKAEALNKQTSLGWKGKAALMFIKYVNWYLQNCKSFAEALKKFKKYAKEVVTDFESLDNECATFINNSFD